VAGHILLVDDDRFFRVTVADVLALRGHAVTAVGGAQEALEAVGRQPFDLVISDVVLEGEDGLALVQQLRERDPEQEVVLVSGTADVKAGAAALQLGVSDALTKPVEEADLLLAVERCLERAALRRERARLAGENLAFARQASVRQRCLELLSIPDLELVQERLLADLASLCDAQTAALWLAEERPPPVQALVLRGYRGLVDRHALPGRLELGAPELAPLAAGVPWEAEGAGGAGVLCVPLVAAGEPVGLVQLSDPLGHAFREEDVASARALADFAVVAVRNGRRFLALQRLGLRDRDTAAYHLSYFTDYASKEIYKARRYARTFSVLTFSLDGLADVRAALGAGEARRAHRGVMRAISRIVRDSDVLAKASEHEFYLLLPETDFFGATMFLRRVTAALREEQDVVQVEARAPLGLVAGAATFPKDGEDYDVLVHTCRRRMDERRASLQRTLVLDPLPFWDEVELLLGSQASPKLPEDPRAEPSRRGKVSDALFDDLQAEIARELLRDPGARGVLYVGGPEVRASLPIAAGLEGAPAEFAARVYVLGRRADLDGHNALTPVFLEGDERISRHEFLLWLSETSAYALLQRRGRGATWGFHTSDMAVVDGLISKLQAQYSLQPL
jgi:diguanylate cyclase (GGDEF)-like protein